MNSLELVEGSDISLGVGARLGRIKGNPQFKDQFNLNFCVMYYNLTQPAFVAPAALPAALQNQLPVFLFGNSDYAGGFEKVKRFFPLTTWVFGSGTCLYGIFNKEDINAAVVPFVPFLNDGDLYFTYQATVGGVIYQAFIIVRCPQVAYGSLLDSINSDVFLMNMLRYVVPGEGALLAIGQRQLRNNILLIKKSIFGKSVHDWIDPTTYITGGTWNTNISDIPLVMEIEKYKGMGLYINYDCINFGWSIMVEKTKKITL